MKCGRAYVLEDLNFREACILRDALLITHAGGLDSHDFSCELADLQRRQRAEEFTNRSILISEKMLEVLLRSIHILERKMSDGTYANAWVKKQDLQKLSSVLLRECE